MVLGGCASVPRGSIPVVDSSGSVYDEQEGAPGHPGATGRTPQSQPQDSGVVVMVPDAAGRSAPIQSFPAPGVPAPGAPADGLGGQPLDSGSFGTGGNAMPAPGMPSGIPSSGGWRPTNNWRARSWRC